MIEFTWNQVKHIAGINHDDNELTLDIKFDTWVSRRKYRIITTGNYAQERNCAINDGIEILIIKE
jgi:hypothetical protein